MFITSEETVSLIQSSGLNWDDFEYIYFDDIPPVNKRYLLCSHQVSPKIITRLNMYIPSP